MLRRIVGPIVRYALCGAFACAPMAALADVKTGVEAWSRGDYAAAIAEWEGPATAGDADALFNLGQAYRLGRGVAVDPMRAESLYARAAAAGHLQAADTYGLMLFQDGRREAALPYVQDAARRGDPRAQYVLGIAHFNGDLVPRDPVRAYALATLAHSAALPQAAAAIRQMDEQIPLAQRQQAASLALQLKQEADAARASEMAAVDLGTAPVAREPLAGKPLAGRPLESPAMRAPQPLAKTEIPASVITAQAAVSASRDATGTEDPASAGASFAGARSTTAQVASVAAPKPAAKPAAVASAAQGGTWRVQLGAFAVRDNALRLWQRVGSRPELTGRQRLLLPTGRVTRLQAGGFATRGSAESACKALSAGGFECLVTQK